MLLKYLRFLDTATIRYGSVCPMESLSQGRNSRFGGNKRKSFGAGFGRLDVINGGEHQIDALTVLPLGTLFSFTVFRGELETDEIGTGTNFLPVSLCQL